jgi:hypothetical protein
MAPGSVLDLAAVRSLAEETGGWTAVTGEVMTVGDRLQVSARAYDTVSERLMARVSFDVPMKGDVRDAYQQIATTLLRGAGLDQAAADLSSATTRSLDAYRAYLSATAHLNRGEYRQARVLLEQAVGLDSSFAQAYAKLAEVSLLAFSVLEPDHPAYRYAERAAALSGRLPARAAGQVRALHSLMNADFSAGRRELEGLLRQDPKNVDALETLASLEFLDPVITGKPGHERRRGSLNAAVRLSTRVLDLDPNRHGAYQGLVAVYSLAGGLPPAAVAGYRRELPRPVRSSVRSWCSCDFELGATVANPSAPGEATPPSASAPDIMYVPLLRDSLELIPVDSLARIPAESLAASRERARMTARAWIRRWLAAGSGEAEAHRAAARVLELDGQYPAALGELDRAEALGVEAEAEAVAARRMILLGKLAKLDDARRIADSLWTVRYFGGDLFSTVPAMTEAYAWATNLFAAARDFSRARAALAAFSARLAMRLELPAAYATTVEVLSGSSGGAAAPLVLPDHIRLAVRDALQADRATIMRDQLLADWLRTLQRAFPQR